MMLDSIRKKNHRFRIVLVGVVVVSVLAAVAFLGTLWLWYLWNATLPELAGWPKIGYWQMFRLFLLAATLAELIPGAKVVVREAPRCYREYILGSPRRTGNG